MSDRTYSTLCEMKELVSELYMDAGRLEEAIEILEELRQTNYHKNTIKELKERINSWIKE